MIKELAEWIESLKQAAEVDEYFSISWFNGTKNAPFAIIGGWLNGFSEDFSDLLCISRENPEYSMCVKVAVNDGPYAYTDFEIMEMPYDKETGEVDNTCVALEWDDDSESLAIWLLDQWERIMDGHWEEI